MGMATPQKQGHAVRNTFLALFGVLIIGLGVFFAIGGPARFAPQPFRAPFSTAIPAPTQPSINPELVVPQPPAGAVAP
ncbi:MAG: hypothetical protein EXR58_08700 [Chloroflexi bacterium]|nr:hypothetical protein [Chloroflexota bacterium]